MKIPFLLKLIGGMKGKNLILLNIKNIFIFKLHYFWFNNLSLFGFQPHKIIKKPAASVASDEEHPTIQIKKVFKPKGPVIDFFKAQK